MRADISLFLFAKPISPRRVGERGGGDMQERDVSGSIQSTPMPLLKTFTRVAVEWGGGVGASACGSFFFSSSCSFTERNCSCFSSQQSRAASSVAVDVAGKFPDSGCSCGGSACGLGIGTRKTCPCPCFGKLWWVWWSGFQLWMREHVALLVSHSAIDDCERYNPHCCGERNVLAKKTKSPRTKLRSGLLQASARRQGAMVCRSFFRFPAV